MHIAVTASEVRSLALACCKIYVSSHRNSKASLTIREVARSHPLAPLLHEFPDPEYNRIGYTLAGALPRQQQQKRDATAAEFASFHHNLPLQIAVLDIVGAALESSNLEEHRGSHPRVGVVDHICFHPLGSAGLEQAASLTRSVAAAIAARCRVPTFVYGAADPHGRALDSIRRDLGYFGCDSGGQWRGGVGNISGELSAAAGYGAGRILSKSGVVVVGATAWVTNYNVPIICNDLRAARRIARRLSSRGGGLPDVQAMALLHGEDVIEIACNLLDTAVTSPEMVQAQVQKLAEEEERGGGGAAAAGEAGIIVKEGYVIGYSEGEVYALASQKLSTL